MRLLECSVLKRDAIEKTKRRKFACSIKCQSPIFDIFFSILTPKTQNAFLSKISDYKIQISRYPKPELYVIKIHIHYTQHAYEISKHIFIFGCAMAQKTGNGDDVTF